MLSLCELLITIQWELGMRAIRSSYVSNLASLGGALFGIHDEDFADREKRKKLSIVKELCEGTKFLYDQELVAKHPNDPLAGHFMHPCVMKASNVSFDVYARH